MVDNINIIPIPKSEQDLLNSTTVNFSLYSPRMVRWGNNKKGEFAFDEEMMTKLKEKSNSSYKATNEILEKKKTQLKNFFEVSSFVIKKEINATLTSPFVTGLGSGHPTEAGMILDRNTGLPYIPASSIKGVLRLAYAINLAKGGKVNEKGEIDDKELEEYFGTQDTNAKVQKRGSLIFMDAYPKNVPNLKVDIMNPHYSKYYSGENKQPVETENPVPIKFLTVEKDCEFTFRVFYSPLANEVLSEEKIKKVEIDIREMFKTAFKTVGFGGKTSIGYGRFKISDNKADAQKQTEKKALPELQAGEYKVEIAERNKNQHGFLFKSIDGYQFSIINCKEKIFNKYKVSDKCKIKIAGQKNKEGLYIVDEILEKI